MMLTFFIFDFWATFGGKIGVAATRDPNSLGPPNPTKNLAHWLDLLGQPLFQNNFFEESCFRSWKSTWFLMFSHFNRHNKHPVVNFRGLLRTSVTVCNSDTVFLLRSKHIKGLILVLWAQRARLVGIFQIAHVQEDCRPDCGKIYHCYIYWIV